MRTVILLALCGLSAACSPKVSDTGYVGTWARGKPETRSIISISKSGDQYRFQWKLRSLDGKWVVSCDASAHCLETYEGKKIGDYQFATRVDPDTGHLLVESEQTSWEADGKLRGTVKDVDEMIVTGEGLELGCFTIERNGTKMPRGEGPQRHFEKISDAVLEPGS